MPFKTKLIQTSLMYLTNCETIATEILKLIYVTRCQVLGSKYYKNFQKTKQKFLESFLELRLYGENVQCQIFSQN